ncbi:MAG TPA: SEC-C metal-binding domain-containing protein [Tepidisphaeraceae bacterium]|jgi:hypothetical protein
MASHAELVERYKELRAKSRTLSNALAKSLPGDVIKEAAKRLGMLKGNEILLETEDEIAVVMDVGLFDVRRNGENAVQRFLRERAPAEGSDERLILEAMRSARHSIFQAVRAQPNVGVLVRDALREDEVFVWDIGFSHTARRGALMAGRLYSPGEVTMTTGATLPVDAELLQDLLPTLAPCVDPVSERFDLSDPQKASECAILIIRECVQAGASAAIRYEDTENAARVARQLNAGYDPPPRLSRGEKVGRNDPCPCGSGKKYKKCCGR